MLQKGRWPEGPEGLWFKQKAEGLQLKKEFLEITPSLQAGPLGKQPPCQQADIPP